MDISLIIIIAATVLISIKGFNDQGFFYKYMFSVGAIERNKEYIRLITAGFLHADFMHLLFNMYTLYIFSPIIIRELGVTSFLLIYLGSILLGNILSLFIYKNNPSYTAIGASGGVSGILFAAIALFPEELKVGLLFIPFYVPGFIFGLLYFSYSVYMMLNPRYGDNIGHSAHLGGAAFGLIFAIIMRPEESIHNALYIGIMSIPLIYLGYEIFVKKRIG